MVGTARACRFDQTIVAIGGAADDVRAGVDLSGAEVVVNDAYGEGCSSSIAAALAVVDARCDVLVLMLGDQPGVTADTVAALLAGRGDAELAVCRYDDGRGHPIAFARSVFGDLATLHGDKGVWRLLDRGGDAVAEVRVPGPDPARRRHARGLRGRAGRGMSELARTASPTSRRSRSGSAAVDYLVDEGLATSMFLGLRLPQPLLLEGEAGVGKTEAARALAAVLDTPLVRLQCYDGIDAAEALYEWNYPRQLLSIRLAEAGGEALREEDLFSSEYLIRRPLLRALEHPGPRPAVLLIDEIDRADDDFEAFLLELLGRGARDDPRARHDHGHPPARDRADLQPHARPARRGQAPLPVPLDRLPVARARGGDRPPPGQGRVRDARRAGRRRRLAHARLRRPEAARDRGGDRLARRARACSGSSGSTRRPWSARSARCSSTTRTRR